MPADTHLDLISKSRLEALSDGIYAIAMTLLVLELRLPPLPHGAAEPAMRAALIELLPKGLTWLLSFAVMASFWVSQQRIFTLATRLDRTMLRLELVQLALIALLPFTTALMGDHGSYVIVSALYAGHLLAMGLLSWLRAAHMLRSPQLHAPALSAAVAGALRRTGWVPATCAALAVALAFFWPPWNMLAMLPMILIGPLARRGA